MIETRRLGDWILERGPNTVLGKPPVRRIVEDADLGARVGEALPEAKRR